MFPNEKCELSAGCTEDKTEGRAAQKSGAAGCEKGRGGLQKRGAVRTALFRSPVSLDVQPAGTP